MRLKPATGVVVLDPASRLPLPAEGADVAPSAYWLRRLRAGDVLEVAPPPDAVVQVFDTPIPDSPDEEN